MLNKQHVNRKMLYMNLLPQKNALAINLRIENYVVIVLNE